MDSTWEGDEDDIFWQINTETTMKRRLLFMSGGDNE